MKYLIVVLAIASIFTACNNDEPEPLQIETYVAIYSDQSFSLRNNDTVVAYQNYFNQLSYRKWDTTVFLTEGDSIELRIFYNYKSFNNEVIIAFDDSVLLSEFFYEDFSYKHRVERLSKSKMVSLFQLEMK